MLIARPLLLRMIKAGIIHVDPFCPQLVGPNSIDIRMGDWLALMRYQAVRNLYDPKKHIWGEIKASDMETKHILTEADLEKAGPVLKGFVLTSNGFYLARTYEEIGVPWIDWEKSQPGILYDLRGQLGFNFQIVAHMGSRSTFARNGLSVIVAGAGIGDIGYHRAWTLEIAVPNYRVPIFVGTPIGQLVFEFTTGCPDPYGGSEHYQDGESVRCLPKSIGLPVL